MPVGEIRAGFFVRIYILDNWDKMPRESTATGQPLVQVTPAMIDAGREAYFRAVAEIDGIECAPTRDQSAYLVSQVFLAMIGLDPKRFVGALTHARSPRCADHP
jgi:hypothetical protein